MSTVLPPAFDAWALPPGIPLPAAEPGGPAERGDVPLRWLDLDAGWGRSLARALWNAGAALRHRPVRDVAAALGRVGERFLSEGDPLRDRALELLPATSGLSPDMASAVLDGMACDWRAARLQALLDAEFADPSALDRFVPRGHGRVRAVGPGLCVQVVSGSVPGVSATALLRALLVKAPTLVKPGRGDVVLPVLLARALAEEDPALGAAVAVVYWPGGDATLEDAVVAEADVVTAYGGDDVVRALRDRTPVTTRFVAYHHRVSVGVVGRAALEADVIHRTASEVAGAAAFFDQRGCVSPQVVWVEKGGVRSPADFVEELARAMEAVEVHLPGGVLDAHEAAALQQVRGTAEMMEAAGSGTSVRHGGAASWTVILDPQGTLTPSCVGRVVRVVPVTDASAVPARIAGLYDHLQTVGVAGFEGEALDGLAEGLAGVGVSRVAPFADVPFPPPWWHHDGRGPLQALVRWVDLDA